MKLNKRVIESIMLASTGAMLTITAIASSTGDNTGNITKVVLDKNGKAGIVVELNQIELNARTADTTILASVEKAERELVSATLEEANTATAGVVTETAANIEAPETITTVTPETEVTTETTTENVIDSQVPAEVPATEVTTEEIAQPETSTETETTTEATTETTEPSTEEPLEVDPSAEWVNKVMANVENNMNVRALPDETSDIVGIFYRKDVAEVISNDGTWTQISSGNVTGYVKNEFLAFGVDAFNLAGQICDVVATVNTDGLRIRSDASEEAGIVSVLATAEEVIVNKDAATVDGWVAVTKDGKSGYVSEQFVSVAFDLGTALTSEEVKAKAAEEAKKAAEAKAAEAAKKAGATVSQKSAVAAGADEVTVLAALLQCEAGGSYDGMLAVASVVMNRVRSGRYPSSISGVIYQSGQFPPALSGRVDAIVSSNSVSGTALQAAQAAIAGTDITGGALQFRSAASGASGVNIGGNVFF